MDAPGMPPGVAAEVKAMSTAARAAIPARTDSNLLVATWNLRAFAGLTAKWEAAPGESPKRDWHAVACIAEVVPLRRGRRSRRSVATSPRSGS